MQVSFVGERSARATRSAVLGVLARHLIPLIPQAVAEDQSEMAVAMVREAVEAEMIPMIPVIPEMVILGILRLKDLQVMKVGMEIAKRPTEILD